MPKPLLSISEVRRVRRLARDGMSAKDVAKKTGKPYGVVYRAITGKTHAGVHSVLPIAPGVLQERRKRPRRTCTNCDAQYQKGGTTTRCGACTIFRYRFKRERDVVKLNKWHHARLTGDELAVLYKRYCAGESTIQLASELPFSDETLRRRFAEAGLQIRGPAGTRQKLTPGVVRYAREQVHIHGRKTCQLAQEFGINYQTMRSAVRGDTWRAVGGPLPERGEEKRPCQICEILTAHSSGKCRYCR